MKENRYLFKVYGEYSDYFAMSLTEKDFEVISKFLDEFNSSVENVSIKVAKE